MSPLSERVLEDIAKYKKALLKFISANDVGITGGHQSGYYLPKAPWRLFTTQPPTRGVNFDHPVTVTWPDDRVTKSTVKWYGQAKSEYRLTGFGSHFKWRTHENLGDLLIIIPKNINEFLAYVLDSEEDIEEIQATLGAEVLESWAVFEEGKEQTETEDICLQRHFLEMASKLKKLPNGDIFSESTRTAIYDCVANFANLQIDEKLLMLMREEYNLYKVAERNVFAPTLERTYKSIDEFIKSAMSIIQARKSRAGRSLENHVEYLLKEFGIPHQMRQTLSDNTRPDIIIPDKKSYADLNFPLDKLFMVGIKTTCKDRWRQVTQEAPRISQKHVLTLQEGISGKQLEEMQSLNVVLIVPKALRKEYPRNSKATILSVQEFIENLRLVYAK